MECRNETLRPGSHWPRSYSWTSPEQHGRTKDAPRNALDEPRESEGSRKWPGQGRTAPDQPRTTHGWAHKSPGRTPDVPHCWGGRRTCPEMLGSRKNHPDCPGHAPDSPRLARDETRTMPDFPGLDPWLVWPPIGYVVTQVLPKRTLYAEFNNDMTLSWRHTTSNCQTHHAFLICSLSPLIWYTTRYGASEILKSSFGRYFMTSFSCIFFNLCHIAYHPFRRPYIKAYSRFSLVSVSPVAHKSRIGTCFSYLLLLWPWPLTFGHALRKSSIFSICKHTLYIYLQND